MPFCLEPVKIWRVENPLVWLHYSAHRMERLRRRLEIGNELLRFAASSFDPPPRTFGLLAKPMRGALLSDISEHYLFHGTSPSGAVGIKEHGFDINQAGKHAGSLYGPGLYFAENSSKSDEYASEDRGGEYAGLCAMLLCRVVLGHTLEWAEAAGPQLLAQWKEGAYDSLLGDREKLKGTYREFVLPPSAARGAYPEYIIIYKRIFSPNRS